MYKKCNLYLHISHLHYYSIILGYFWLQKHNLHICWKENTIVFDSSFCQSHCLSKSSLVTISGLSKSEPSQISPVFILILFKSSPNIINPSIFKLCLNIVRIGVALFTIFIKNPGHKVFTINLRDLDWVVKPLWKLASDTNINPKTIVLSKYHEFFNDFSYQKSDQIPLYGTYNYQISLKEGTKPLFGLLYGMSYKKNEELCKYLFENLNKGFIRASQFFTALSIFFVQKPQRGLQFCINYCGFNITTIENWYPLLLITETVHRFSQMVIYCKFDIIVIFNQLRIAKGEEWKTAFCTYYGLFKYVVLPFSLCNSLALFQYYINDTLHKYLDIFCTLYLDDILTYNNSLHKHKKHVKIVLECLKSTSLFLDMTKYEFHITKVLYLEFIISTYSVKMDLAKIKIILEWTQPICWKDVQSFLGFANFYQCFIFFYSTLIMPLVNFTKKNTFWS